MKRFLLSLLFSSCVFSLISSFSFGQQGEWTWMKGSSGSNGAAVYGTQGVSNPNNTPGALYEATQWTDKQGNFWLFGGLKDFGSEYNTFWKFDPAINEWTWMKGSTNCCQAGNYGIQGIPSSTNMPGARAWGSWSWVDTAGHLWLYGGIGDDGIGGYQVLSDLWKYDVTTNQWTWMDGPNTATIPVEYGTLGTPSATSSPGARAEGDAAWVDDSNRLWLFGGALYFPQMGGWSIGGFGNDMWMWDPNINEWTWMQGTQTLSGSGVYGTKGVADSSNYPPGRGSYCNWKDEAGNFYFFAGYNLGYCWNDLWIYDWQTNVFTWVSGPSTPGGIGTYGTQGVPDTNNIPAARYENRCFWQDHCGNFWLWGGAHTGGNSDVYNDLWVYNPATKEWTWISGQSSGIFNGVYGTQGISSPTNEPPSKYGSVGWIDSTGNLWMFGGGEPGFTSAKNDLWRYVPDPSNCLPPAINFGVSDTFICEKFCIDFFDSSLNNPVAWQWFFPGGTPGSSTLQNPINICYQDPGEFDVMLIATSANGVADTLLLNNYLTVYQNPFAPTITQSGNTLTCSNAASYQWQLNAVDIPGATNQSYTITQSGLYTVIIGDENDCNAQASTQAYLVGIPGAEEDWYVNVFPNPSNGIFNVDVFVANEDEVHFTVLNTLGQSLEEKTERLNLNRTTTSIDLRNWSQGVYFLVVKAGYAVTQFRLMRY